MYLNAIAEFVFDQLLAYGAFPKDALNAKEMNVRPGGKQGKMYDTAIPMDNPNPSLCSMPQTMVFPVDLPSKHPDHAFLWAAEGYATSSRGAQLIIYVGAGEQWQSHW